MADKTYITQRGKNKLKEELKFLRETRRIDVASKIKEARDAGDILENSVYDVAIDEQSYIEGRIGEIEGILSNAELLKLKNGRQEEVQIGCTVVVRINNDEHTFTLVGSVEADPSKKMISHESPLGKALLGAKRGDLVEVKTPTVNAKYKVIDIK